MLTWMGFSDGVIHVSSGSVPAATSMAGETAKKRGLVTLHSNRCGAVLYARNLVVTRNTADHHVNWA